MALGDGLELGTKGILGGESGPFTAAVAGPPDMGVAAPAPDATLVAVGETLTPSQAVPAALDGLNVNQPGAAQIVRDWKAQNLDARGVPIKRM